MSQTLTHDYLAEAVRRKTTHRIVRFTFILYIVAYLDRANIAFAKIPMSLDLGFSEAVFGFGAGIFFFGYLLFEIPGAILVERWSARKWFARILISWGFCTILVGFVHTANQFYLARFFLGVAEAGFFPGIIVYFSHWFTKKDRARAFSGFIMGIPLAIVLGAPSSALILKINWLGLPGWRWVFILEGLPAIFLGIITLFYLPDHPAQAKWLNTAERDWLTSQLEEEKLQKRALGHVTIWQALKHRNVILLSLALFIGNTGAYAFTIWLPTIIHNSSGLSPVLSTLCSALPFAAAIGSILFIGWSSDLRKERKYHTAIPMVLAGTFLFLSTLPHQSFLLVMMWLILTGAAAYCASVPFWVLPTTTLSESAAAASIGLINSVGNLGGFFGPTIVGYVLSHGFSFTDVVMFLSFCFILAGVFVLAIKVPNSVPEADAILMAETTKQ